MLDGGFIVSGRLVDARPWGSQGGTREGGALGGTGRSVTLSNTHISPHIDIYTGGSLIKTCKGYDAVQIGGGKRGKIKGFSYGSRMRLLYLIAKIKRTAELPFFVTLTYPDNFPQPGAAKKEFQALVHRLKREFPGIGIIWKLEPQKRGAPHFHLLIWGCEKLELMRFIPRAWFDIAGQGDINHMKWHNGDLGNGNKHCVQEVRSFKGVWWYAAKYIGKTFEVAGWGEKWTGRFWGVINRENIPFGELVTVECDRSFAVQLLRYQRRFAHIKGRDRKSLNTFCDADQWARKLLLLPSEEYETENYVSSTVRDSDT
jgi:hypothetical protein